MIVFTKRMMKINAKKNTKYYEPIIVKFHNDLNKVAFSGFTKRELAIFFSMVALINDQGGDEVSITFDELRRVIERRFESHRVFANILSSTVSKLQSGQANIP